MTEFITAEIESRQLQLEKEELFTREWLVTNGLGGYASGTVPGVITRRYHGFLITALPAPFGRIMMLNDLQETLHFNDGISIRLGGEERSGGPLQLHGAEYLKRFHLELGLPVWRYEVKGYIIEKRILMPYRQNTVHITYRLLAGDDPLRIELRPAINFRSHDAPVCAPLAGHYVLTVIDEHFEFSAGRDWPQLRMMVYSPESTFTFERKNIREVVYRTEESRGYEGVGDLWSAGYFSVELGKGHSATLVASTERWETILTLRPTDVARAEAVRRTQLIDTAPEPLKEGPGKQLLFAADQFLIIPAWRREDMARAHASGGELGTIIAGYHWFTDWGRDSMISLEGLSLIPGRFKEAASILNTFAGYIENGLIPNTFPEAQKKGRYNTADATLWFFHAIDRYLSYTNDKTLLQALMPKLKDIVEHHLKGTRFGIKVEDKDGLLTQGEAGYQLTWMDAKAEDWIVTPRRGKAVEINALWYNALKLLQEWSEEAGESDYASQLAAYAEKNRSSFNARFWYAPGGYLYDVVDGEQGNDDACRPNQLLALSLHYPVLDEKRWEAVVTTVKDKLLTPVGLRSLAPGHPDYKEKYYGNLNSRDAAYHQGTVWAWLIGPFLDAWLRVYPSKREEARDFLKGFKPHLNESCIGSISEIFDAEPPYTPRGCIAQAWSIAEVLRSIMKTSEVKT